jgi:FSR family fosmidomycin resistance protein-like MFS transporter
VADLYGPALPAIIALLVLQQGYTYLAAGLLITVYNSVSSFTQPVIGRIHDRRGTGLPLGLSILISGVFISLVGVAGSYPLILLCCAIAALGHAAFHPVALATTGRLSEDANRGRLLSYFVVGGNLGFALGPVVAGVALDMFGLTGTLLLALPALAIALLLYFLYPAGSARAHGTVDRHNGESVPPTDWRAMAILLSASSLRAVVIFGSVAFLPAYLVGLGYDLLTANILSTAMLAAGVAGQMTGGALSDRHGRKGTIVTGMAVAMVALPGFLFTTGWVSLLFLLVFGFALWSSFSVTLAIAHELMPGELGLSSGLLLGFSMGLGGLGVAAIGSLADAIGLAGALASLLIPLAAATVLMAVLPYRGRKAAKGPSPSSPDVMPFSPENGQ